MSENMHDTDVCIIGAGPVGLFSIFECGMLRMRCHVVDALDSIGGQCVALYPEKPIYDIPGYPRIDAGALIARLDEQTKPFEPVYHLGQQVSALTQSEGGRWCVETSAGAKINCAVIVVAAGCGAFGPNRPPLDGIEAFEATGGVQYLVKRREDLRGKRVVIAGGGDSAVDWALSLCEVAASVQLVHRRDKYRAAPESVTRLRQLAADGRLELVVPYQLAGLLGSNGRLESVLVESLDGVARRLEADVMLAFYGLSMDLGPISAWGLALERNHVLVDAATCETSAKGVFAIGDIAHYPGKLKLILSGFSEAAMAAHAMFAVVHPGEVLHFEYSTTAGIPKTGG